MQSSFGVGVKIGIILHPFAELKQAGLGEYIFELTKSLIECDKGNEYIIFLKPFDRVRGEVKLPSFRGNNWQVISLGFGRFWREVGLFFAPKADIYVFNTPIMPLFFRPKKSIVIALDFAYLYFNKPKNLKEQLNNSILFWLNKFSLKRADVVVAISEATKSDVVKFFGIAEAKIKVIYPGFRNICDSEDSEAKPPKYFGGFASDLKPYFLFVGVIKERKNVFNIVSAFIEFKKKYNLSHKLVIIGKGGGQYLDKINELIKKEKTLRPASPKFQRGEPASPELKRGEQSSRLRQDFGGQAGQVKEIIFTGYVSDEQLIGLYKNAEVLVFPSLVEGFGFPLLEAMSCGVPVITSNISSLTEVAGKAALLIDPYNISEMAEAMYKIASDNILQQDLINKGLTRVKNFSWQKTAEEFLATIDKNIPL